MSAGEPPNRDRMLGRYRGALCGSTLLMVVLSWPLWVDDADFPTVPFFAGMPIFPAWISWLVLGGIAVTLALAALGLAWRLMIGVSLPLLVFAILQDQNRFQPWVYQYAMIGLALAFSTPARGLRLARWYVVGLYFYSGLSKLDASFRRELGLTILSAGLGLFGVSPETWSAPAQTVAVLAMPGFEIAVAISLLFRSTRRIGLAGAVAQHSALVLILGPWNLGHSTIVLVWNFALVVQDILLFGSVEIPGEPVPERWPGRVARLVFWAAMVLPLGERWGLCDAWPGHALYASHSERSDVYLHEDNLERLPQSIRRRLGPADVTPWRRLNQTAWSRDFRGTPMYPSGRVGNAVAEFLEVRFGGTQPVRLVQWGRAAFWDAKRDRDESLGLRAIRRRGDRFWLNAHPSPP